MATNPSDPTTNTARPGGLQSMLARLKGMVQPVESGDEKPDGADSTASDAVAAAPSLENDLTPTGDGAAAGNSIAPAVPVATPVALAPDAVVEDIPVAQPVPAEAPPA